MNTLCVLGRQPDISLAELESIYGSEAVFPHTDSTALLHAHPSPQMITRLGGTQKIARHLSSMNAASWEDIDHYLEQSLPLQLQSIHSESKINVGISLYGMKIPLKTLQQSSFRFKKALKKAGHKVRIIPNKHLELSSAQVFHNELASDKHFELIISVSKGGDVHFGKTIAVQNIDAYTARDQQRPKRDAKVGMLPPKLAQIIINLAHPSPDANKKDDATPFDIYDPFCGTGVLPQEALLMGLSALGSDLEQRMVDYSSENLDWLLRTFAIDNARYRTIQADATDASFEPMSSIACETYLGRPFSGAPTPSVLKKVVQDVNTIHTLFLKNVARQTSPGFRMCIAIPAWKTKKGFVHLPMLDSVDKLGYNRVSFVHSNNDELIYHRPEQVVGRELTVLERK